MHTLPETGYLRLPQIIDNPKADPPIPAIIPVSRSTWWSGVKSGRYPQPTRALGARITAWPVASIRALIDASAPSTAANATALGAATVSTKARRKEARA